MAIGKKGRVHVEDIVFLIRKDPKKYARVKVGLFHFAGFLLFNMEKYSMLLCLPKSSILTSIDRQILMSIDRQLRSHES
jgi:hypothetical protein